LGEGWSLPFFFVYLGMEDKKQVMDLLKQAIAILESNVENEGGWGVDVEELCYWLGGVVRDMGENK